MTLTKKQKEEVKTAFISCENIEELVVLLNKINTRRHKNPYWNFPQEYITVKNLKYFLYAKKEKYSIFEIPKKSGGSRKIQQPHQFLKLVQRLLNICFNACFTPMPTATGFVTGRSIVDNAKKHTNKKYVYNLDLKDFFPSISFHRIRAVLTKVPPFKLNTDIAHIVANLCCHENKLPQGASTSPILSNFVCKRLDAKLWKLSKKMGFTFSRYADDITISCNKNIFTPEFKAIIFNIIKEEGFELNEKKERLQRYNVKDSEGKYIRERQEVTGIIVNEKTNVPRKFMRNLKATIYNWQKHGYAAASAKHELYYKREKGFLRYLRYNGKIPSLEMVVAGKIEYLGMVRGKDDGTYRLMKLQFDELCIKQNMTVADFMTVFDLIEKEGIKKAADFFYNRRNVKLDNG